MTAPASEKYVHKVVPADQWPVLGLSELWQMRRILFVLAQRLLKVRYQHTALGIGWVVLQPLLLVLIVSVFMGLVIPRPAREGLPFAVWLFPAWVAWRVFQKLVNEGGRSVGANGALVQRIYLPRIYFPTAVALASLVDLGFMMLAQLVLQGVYLIRPGPGLLLLPVAVVIMYLAALGVLLLLLVVLAAVPRHGPAQAPRRSGLVLDVAHHLSGHAGSPRTSVRCTTSTPSQS